MTAIISEQLRCAEGVHPNPNAALEALARLEVEFAGNAARPGCIVIAKFARSWVRQMSPDHLLGLEALAEY